MLAVPPCRDGQDWQMSPMDRMLTPEQVAEVLAVSPSTVTRWLRVGHLPGRNLANGKRKACWRVNEQELKDWVAKRPST